MSDAAVLPRATRGGRPDRHGAFVEATILTGVTPQMRAYREEHFGPAAVVYKVKDAEGAVTLANPSVFGLGATVMSSGLVRECRGRQDCAVGAAACFR